MTEVLEAKKALDDARAQSKDFVDRRRALFGLSMIRARERGATTQPKLAHDLQLGMQQIRAYEKAYRDWLRDHPGESLDA